MVLKRPIVIGWMHKLSILNKSNAHL